MAFNWGSIHVMRGDYLLLVITKTGVVCLWIQFTVVYHTVVHKPEQTTQNSSTKAEILALTITIVHMKNMDLQKEVKSGVPDIVSTSCPTSSTRHDFHSKIVNH